MDKDRDTLLRELMALDFVAVDLGLYLNTHPHDVDILAKYNETVREADKLRMEYESLFGPLTLARSASRDVCYNWISKPWPWQ